MASEAFAHGSIQTGSHPVISVITREAGQWLLARTADGHDAPFTIEVDERFWRLRRCHGTTSSMFEARLPAALSAGDLAAAIARWAAGAGLAARSTHDDGSFRVTLTRSVD